MKKAYIETYGCQMNVNDTEVIFAILENAGYTRTEDMNQADLVMANTCSIRENADAYLIPGSLHVTNMGDEYLETTISQIYDPVKETRSNDSDSSSSSGRSSYSSSYSGSSGNIHSGSGRNF